MTDNLRDPAPPVRPAPPTRLRFDAAGRHARRRRPLHEHRAVPQGVDRGHVPVVHGHPGRGALHPGPRERPGQGAVHARSARGARRRAAARDPRPVPGVQGLQERVPARRRHGGAEVRGARRLPRSARRPAPLAHVRVDPGAEPAGLGQRSRCRTSPAAGGPPGVLARALARHQRRPAAAPVPAARPAPLVPAAAAARPAPASQGELVFLADSFTTFTEPAAGQGGDRAARTRRLAGPARGRGLLRPGQPLQGAARPGPADGGGHGRAPG